MILRTPIAKCAIAALLAALSVSGVAQDGRTDVTQQIGLEQRLGQKVPLDAMVTDENGNKVPFGSFFGKRPVVLMLIFYKCNGSCLLVAEEATKTFNRQKRYLVGRDYDVVALSIHPKETPELARAKKQFWLSNYRHDGAENGWHALVAEPEEVAKITDAIGYRFVYEEATDRVAHPAGLILLTKDGVISRVLYGVNYPASDFFNSMTDAIAGRVGPRDPQPILWGCLQYDPATGRYRLVVERVLRVAGLSTAFLLFASVAYMSVRYRRQPLTRHTLKGPKDPGSDSGT